MFIGFGCLTFIFMYIYALNASRSKSSLGNELIAQAMRFDAKANPEVDEESRQMILNAQDLYSPKEFEEFITTKDSDGWDIIMHYAANGQRSQLMWLLDLLKTIYGSNQKTIFEIMYEKDRYGRSPLYIAVMRKQVGVVKVLLEKAKEFFGDNKDLFYTFTQSPDDLSEQTPLMLAAYLNQYEIMKTLLKYEVEVFGPADKRLQRELRKAYALSDAKGQQLIQEYHDFPESKE